ncbi:protein-disulfide reductase DsbD family protein [Cellvibrio japonicus]|uniref:C-type cytochrome biogenesis protein n=1 Tax=Cellvibrio japonicus (strain Ueda107) TaxID=498211 RepID=B3PBH1_CELJU|nr:protein-disulfide reductase DsbD [Cellvibrio japonicus]ACE85165.1 c-type cytochrome biogenesis protein [Cellvibrio japonicus Ueda107]QEI13087.1 protein-disulfide reductase DsbD [Cellvibrio japonicus]QEI16661.1 protein-disulfide reductase DsbD [Cellvibrio japonicus]QEI20239.1 protein-disulfide reductase DsbD [Cellvibrio japonicus]
MTPIATTSESCSSKSAYNSTCRRWIYSLAILWLATCACLVQAQDLLAPKSSPLGSNLLTQQDEFLPVDEAFVPSYRIAQGKLLLHWDIADTYYLYEERFKFRSPDGVSLTPVYTPGKMKYDELFERETMVHYYQVTAAFDLGTQRERFTLNLEYQGCADAGLCYPPQKRRLAIDPVAQTASLDNSTPVQASPITSPPAADTSTPTAASGWLLQAILFAILGGAILNLMPCVFPVLSIKVMSLAAADRRRLGLHGWIYTLGIVLCFVAFAIALLVARTGGEAIGWGFQLQSPGLIAALTYLFFVMGLSMSGLVHFGSGLMGAGQNLTQKSGLSGSFFTGVLAAVVASPCTAPFMGAALGFALTQPAYVCIAIFAALGFGMALPLLLLCYMPVLAQKLPRPGAWMDNLKQFLAFPLYLSAIWLLWVYGRQTGTTAMAALCAGALAIAFACWLYGRHAQGLTQMLRRVAIVLSLATALWLPYKELHPSAAQAGDHWQAYSPELLQSLRDQGRPVFVNLTADWCLTCLANERVTLDTDTVKTLFAEHQVAALKGDWTNTDPQITQLLQEYGRSGVPLYLWFPADRPGKADVLPQLLTKDHLIQAVTHAN